MFRKLVSRLPFQPNLLGDLVRYQRRLHREHMLRRTGAMLLVVLLVLQILIIATPHTVTNQTSVGDIILGAQKQEDVMQAYLRGSDLGGRDDIRQIFAHYGIADGQLSSADVTTLQVTKDSDYYRTSRVPIDGTSGFVNIDSVVGGGIYESPLLTQKNGNYPALSGMTSFGYRFWVLLEGSGSIVYERSRGGVNLEINDTNIGSEQVGPGDEALFQIRYRNSGKSPAINTSLSYSLPSNIEYIDYSSSSDVLLSIVDNTFTWRPKTMNNMLAPSQSWATISVRTKIKSLSGQQHISSCNSLKIEAVGVPAVFSSSTADQRCVVIAPSLCPGTGIPVVNGDTAACAIQCQDGAIVSYKEACDTPLLACSDLSISTGGGWNQKVIRATVLAQPGASAKSVAFYDQGRLIGTADPMDPVIRHTLDAGSHIITAHVTNTDQSATDAGGCSASITVSQPIHAPEPMLTKHVSVSNTKPHVLPGDTLTYAIRLTNNSATATVTVPLTGEFGVSIADVLEYATLIDSASGTYDERISALSWDAVTLKPGESTMKSFSVQLSSQLPSNPTSGSNPLSYDNTVSVVYGNELRSTLPLSGVKRLERTLFALPSTLQPLALLGIALLILGIVVLYVRARIYSNEIDEIHDSFSGGAV